MKRTLSIILLSTLCLAGSACKSTATEKAADKIEDKTDKVGEKAENVGEQARDVTKQGQDLGEAKQDLGQATDELAQAKDQYMAALTDRLVKLDARLAELKAKGPTVPPMTIADLQARRDALAAKIQTTKDQPATAWSDFQSNMEKSFDDLEKALGDAS